MHVYWPRKIGARECLLVNLNVSCIFYTTNITMLQHIIDINSSSHIHHNVEMHLWLLTSPHSPCIKSVI